MSTLCCLQITPTKLLPLPLVFSLFSPLLYPLTGHQCNYIDIRAIIRRHQIYLFNGKQKAIDEVFNWVRPSAAGTTAIFGLSIPLPEPARPNDFVPDNVPIVEQMDTAFLSTPTPYSPCSITFIAERILLFSTLHVSIKM